MAIGRPSLKTPELLDEICRLLSEGQSLRKICLADEMPDLRTVMRWLDSDADFCQQYARARELQQEHYADEIMEIADEPPPMAATKFGEAVDSGAVQHQRLRVDTRKWLMSKLAPKKYGDKLDVDHRGTVALEVVRFGQDSDPK